MRSIESQGKTARNIEGLLAGLKQLNGEVERVRNKLNLGARGSLIGKLLIIAPVTLALILISLSMPAQKVTIDGIGRLSFESKITISVGQGVAYASPDIERQSPDVLLLQTNLSGSISDIQDDPDSPDANWLDAVQNNNDTVCHVTFPTPTGNPTQGAGLQEFKIWVKKWDGTGTPTVRIDLYEAGTFVANILANSDVTSASGQLFSGTWDASLLGTADGSGVECYIYGDAVGGAPSSRATVCIGAVEWNVEYTVADISNTPTSKDFGLVGNGSFNWSNGSAPTFPLDDGECFFTVTNNSSGPVDITIEATDFTGGVGWTLAASPGENIATMKAGRSGDNTEGDMVTLTTSNQAFISGLAATDSKKWEIKLETPTSFTDGVLKTSTVKLTATLS